MSAAGANIHYSKFIIQYSLFNIHWNDCSKHTPPLRGTPLPAVTSLSFGLESKLSDSQLSKCSERGGCRVIPAQIVLFVAIADNHKKYKESPVRRTSCGRPGSIAQQERGSVNLVTKLWSVNGVICEP